MPVSYKGLTIKEKAERYLEDALCASLPDPYDYHSVVVNSDFIADNFVYSVDITFMLPSGQDKTYNIPVYGLNESDMKGAAIRACQRLFKDCRQYLACDF